MTHGISVPWPGIEPGPLQWKHGALTTELPGKSLLSPWLAGSSLFQWPEGRGLDSGVGIDKEVNIGMEPCLT